VRRSFDLVSAANEGPIQGNPRQPFLIGPRFLAYWRGITCKRRAGFRCHVRNPVTKRDCTRDKRVRCWEGWVCGVAGGFRTGRGGEVVCRIGGGSRVERGSQRQTSGAVPNLAAYGGVRRRYRHGRALL
jgi:hypothetical protein